MNREILMNAGIDYDAGVNRFAGKNEIYEKYLVKMFDADPMKLLKSQLQERNYADAFRTAHDLKGNAGNLSMTAFYDIICKLVCEIKGGKTPEDIDALYDQAYNLYEQTRRAVLSMEN